MRARLASTFRSINALTLATRDMRASCKFYETLGLTCSYGGADEPFSTFSASTPTTLDNNSMHVNLFASDDYTPPPEPGGWNGWGRCVFFVDDVGKQSACVRECSVAAACACTVVVFSCVARLHNECLARCLRLLQVVVFLPPLKPRLERCGVHRRRLLGLPARRYPRSRLPAVRCYG